ncbi:MAG: hypothetical protein R3338_15020 [Thermoanaerobaculia bacterium]|nr:hypothetical protein [Thermoanaerobaculia bacterium]
MKKQERDEEYCPLCLMLEEAEGLRIAVPYDEILKGGISLPPADLMTDTQIAKKIDELVAALAGLRICLMSTDHLSDRELYQALCDDILREPMEICPGSENGAITIDIIGGCSNEDIETYLTYYADEETREIWTKDFPDDPLPEKKPRPYDRDRFFPTMEMLVMSTRGEH